MRSLILAADDISPWEIDQKKAAKQNKHKMLSSQLHENYKHCRWMGRMYVKLCTIAL